MSTASSLECGYREEPSLIDFSTTNDVGVAVCEKRDGVQRVESPTASTGDEQGESNDDERVLQHDEGGNQNGQVSLRRAPEHDTEHEPRHVPRHDVEPTDDAPEHDDNTFAEASTTTEARPGHQERARCKTKCKGHGNKRILAKVDSRRKLRHSPPGSTPMSSKFGPASRWGELSKAHLEFRRLGTARE